MIGVFGGHTDLYCVFPWLFEAQCCGFWLGGGGGGGGGSILFSKSIMKSKPRYSSSRKKDVHKECVLCIMGNVHAHASYSLPYFPFLGQQ